MAMSDWHKDAVADDKIGDRTPHRDHIADHRVAIFGRHFKGHIGMKKFARIIDWRQAKDANLGPRTDGGNTSAHDQFSGRAGGHDNCFKFSSSWRGDN